MLATPWHGWGHAAPADLRRAAGGARYPVARRLAAPAAKISREPLTARARPPDAPTWVADHEAVGRHILGHDRTSSNEGMLADGHAADHYNPGAQSGPCCTMVGRSSAPWRLVCARGRAQVSSECDSWTKKYVIADMHALDDHDLVLDSDAVADRCAVLHEGSIADVAVTADAGAGKDMGERPDSRPVPNLLALAQSARIHGDTVQWQGSRHGTTHQLLAVHPPRRHASADNPRNSLAARNCRDGRSLLIVHGRDAEENDRSLVSKSKQFGYGLDIGYRGDGIDRKTCADARVANSEIRNRTNTGQRAQFVPNTPRNRGH